MRTFELVDDKSKFTTEAERAGLTCVPAITVSNAQSLLMLMKCFAAMVMSA